MTRSKDLLRPAAALACLGVGIAAMAVAAGERDRAKTRELTVTGTVVDLHSFMTGKYQSSDKAACTRECIRSGVPAALETKDGLFILGQGPKGPMKTLAKLAFQEIEVKGTVHERNGIRYLDIADAKPVDRIEGENPDNGRDMETSDSDDEIPDRPQGEGMGACCLSEGGCHRTSQDSCDESGGEFYEGVACEDIECG